MSIYLDCLSIVVAKNIFCFMTFVRLYTKISETKCLGYFFYG